MIRPAVDVQYPGLAADPAPVDRWERIRRLWSDNPDVDPPLHSLARVMAFVLGGLAVLGLACACAGWFRGASVLGAVLALRGAYGFSRDAAALLGRR